MEFFTKDGLVWWIGVVEDRNDPEQLGRCRVRIFGYHTDDTSILPTSDLPWAVVMQPITSAAISGKGTSPIGPLEGTWVIGWFLDGADKQQPLIMGTYAGKPKESIYNSTAVSKAKSIFTEGNYVKSESGEPVVDSQGNPILSGTSTTTDSVITNILPPLDVDNIQKLMTAIGNRESSNNYLIVNRSGYQGKYQFGAAALIDLGYVKAGTTNRDLANATVWTGKDGMTSNAAFLGSNTVQDSAMYQLLKVNYDRLLKSKKLTSNDPPEKVAGLLAAAHLVGSGNADKYDKKDGNGVKAATYYSLGSVSVGGTGFVPREGSDTSAPESNLPGNPNNPSNDPFKSLNHPAIAKSKGFEDPNKVYPTKEYAGLSDVNKLAIGDSSHASLIEKENNRIKNIPLANSGSTWEEPDSPFSARYPYNHVHETEAGHVVEFDSTPGSERIHVYHKSGTYIEIDSNGTTVKKSNGSNYEIVDKNNYIYVKGAYNLTVDGATKIYVRDRADIQIEGDTNIIGNGNMNITAAKNAALFSKNTVVTGTESIGIISDGDVSIQGRNIFLKAIGNMNLDAGSTFSARGGILAALHGALVKIKMGAQKLSQLGVALPPPGEKSPEASDVADPIKATNDYDTFRFDSGEDEAREWAAGRVSSGAVNNTVLNASAVSNNANLVSTARVQECDCTEFRTLKEFPLSLKLSKHFTLGAVSGAAAVSKYPLKENAGLTRAQLACNLKFLTTNALDRIKDRYPDMIVTSGFRPGEKSDHGRGMAADMQFTKHKFSEYYEISLWIRDNVPFSQLLLEYETRSKGTISWIHIALNSNYSKNPLPTATFKNHAVYARNQFVNLG
jgi:hypothetical protein